MKLIDLVRVMNIADVSLTSRKIPELYGLHALDMFNKDGDPLLVKYGDHEVESLTNVGHAGDVICIK